MPKHPDLKPNCFIYFSGFTDDSCHAPKGVNSEDNIVGLIIDLEVVAATAVVNAVAICLASI